jgi:hypothetical protein
MSNSSINNFQEQPPYSFDQLMAEFKWLIKTLPDKRRGTNKSYSIIDAALGAFAVFFMQFPSFLSHQSKMYAVKGISNAQSLFQIDKIPSDNQIRNLLDPIAPTKITPMFDSVFNGLNSMGYFEHYRNTINKTVLIALDGVNYFSSSKIHCNKCNVRRHKNGKIGYYHYAVTPVIVAPKNPRVISLPPEFISPQPNYNKQDGEHAAVKRWLKEHGRKYKELKITILGDDLYSHQPICEAIKQEGFHFLLTCKPDSHTTLYAEVGSRETAGDVKKMQFKRITGIRVKKVMVDTYRFANAVALRNTDDSLLVNWCELTTTNEADEIVFINSYITDHQINSDNVIDVVNSGRTRWKIENENNNVLKNHGYNLEHNFGHGKCYLSQLLLTFNLLAFLFHTVLSIMDVKYQTLREKLPTRKMFFDHIKALTTYLFFDNWDALLQFMLDGLQKRFEAKDLVSIYDSKID